MSESDKITQGLLVRNTKWITAKEYGGIDIEPGTEFTVIERRGDYVDVRFFRDRQRSRMITGHHVEEFEPVPGPEGLRSMLRIG